MKRFMLSAMHSGSGKTVVTCGLLRAFQDRGLSVESFKCGPDYIDPMFHRQVLGLPSRNLDLFLQGPEGVRDTLSRQTAQLALVEGAMGYYDGVNGTDEASAWQVADLADLPVVLVLRPKGISLTLAAQVQGMLHFRTPSHIAGVILTDCKPMLYAHWKPILAQTGVRVLGYLPPMDEAVLESRHLGLILPDEVAGLQHRFAAIARQMEQTVDLTGLLDLAAETRPVSPSPAPAPQCRIAVTRDEAFCFLYRDSLDALEAAGAELVFFSPLRDAPPEKVHGLYLCGGYPELHGETLSRNTAMTAWVRAAVTDGLPTVAECGGFLYLLERLQDREGKNWPMAGALPGESRPTDSLQRFGYLRLTEDKDSLLFRAGEPVPAHEFHYWEAAPFGGDLRAEKPSGRTWRCGYTGPALYAGFPHLHLGGALPLAERFVRAAVSYKEGRK